MPLLLTYSPFSEPFQVETTDVELVNWQIREGFTSALIFDRSARSKLFQTEEPSFCRISDQLKTGARLVVVGDPGCGKTTLLRFLAYSYAYSYACRQLPSRFQDKFVSTLEIPPSHKALPDEPWLPVTLTCRDLLDADLNSSLIELIQYQLQKLHSSSSDIQLLTSLLEEQLQEGKVLLLIDGLDEIPTEEKRSRFAELIADQARIYSQTPIIITSRVVGFRNIRDDLDSFKHLNVGSLKIEDKKRFIHAFSTCVGIRFRQNPTLIENSLEPLVCHSRKVAKLCENIFLLTLISQVFLRDSYLPNRRLDIYRRTVELMIERRNGDWRLPLTLNEVCPHLEYLAYCMRLDGSQHWTEPKVLRTIQKLREHEPDMTILGQRTPAQFLDLLINQSGLLNIAGLSEPDERGFDHRLIQFFHQSFQEYFAAQALLHGRGIFEKTDVLDELRQKVRGLDIVERKVETLGSGGRTEPVVAGSWQEVVRFCICDLDRKSDTEKRSDVVTSDDAMLMLLPSHGIPTREVRALAVFALQVLAEEPNLRSDTIDAVIDSAIDNLNELDGINSKPNTLMDEAWYSAARSCFGQQCRDRLLQSYIQSRDVRRNKIGSIYSLMTTNDEILNAENAAQILEPLLAKLNSSCSVEERVEINLRLVEIFFRPQAIDSSVIINFLPSNILQNTINLLLKTTENEAINNDLNDAILSSAMWALAWLTTAKDKHSCRIYTFSETERKYLQRIVIDERRDAYPRMWSALILSASGSEKNVFDQVDWLYEWAEVADGIKPHKELPTPSTLYRLQDIDALNALINSNLPMQAKRWVAIAMGRLGYFVSEIAEPLLQVLQDDLLNNIRDEALVYLVFAGGDKVASSFIKKINFLEKDEANKDSHYFRLCCVLALIAMGNVSAIKHQLNFGVEKKQSYRNAYAYALVGVASIEGFKALEAMKNHENVEIRNSINNALLRMTEWNAASVGQDKTKSSASQNFAYIFDLINVSLEQIKGKSSLAHRLKSAKTFAGSSYFTKLVNRNNALVYDIRTKDRNKNKLYYIVKIYKHKHAEYRSKMSGDFTFNLLDYGEILYQGYGEPPSYIKGEMQKIFGMYEDSKPEDFETEVIWEDGGEVRFIVALEKKDKYWFIVKIDPNLHEEYKLKVKEEKMNISDYGEILYRGKGDMPSSDMQAKIFKELGI
ncbi:hypothetical protein FACHB389_02400 [Nostoc calcicola FACHB-389]|nr:hypothetical protein FACHB389_02400 [Nostoc calcicola FACHB-389]